jgi:predicted ATPase/DNA-binding SARP family transcriptional activator
VQIAVLGPLEVRGDAGPSGAPDSGARLDGVSLDGAFIEVPGTRLRALLVRLALAAPGPVAATTLVDALWGDEPPAEPVNALQSLVSRLRRALNRVDVVVQVAGGYRLLIGRDDLDLNRFDGLARRGRDELRAARFAQAAATLRAALALWRSELADVAIERDEPLAVRLHEQRLDALTDRIEADLALRRELDLVAELEQLSAAYPLRERLTMLLMQALNQAGRTPEALATYERARRVLAEELGIDPSAQLQAAHLALLRGEAITEPIGLDQLEVAGATGETGAPRSRSNLRAQLTSFVGREDDVRRIGKLLEENRLVTLVGPGGAGKTRLATEAATRLLGIGDDGVWLAELAPVTDPADVVQVVLAAFGLRDSTLIDLQAPVSTDAITRLIDAIGEQSFVLVVDNCEHLIDAAAQLADELLARCPRLRILTTSREPLGVYGEFLVAVAPLGQPAANADPSRAMQYPATQLFADRAAAVRPDFVVDEQTVRAVVEIVRRLDGLPLAIELAAARLRTMSVEQVAARLSDRFRLLTGGSRTALPRHRTLRAVVEWSWDLLTEDERRLARRLAVFVGGITATGAGEVCASSELPASDIEDLLGSLVDKSLLQVAAAQGRFRMLETLREFGLERMAELGEMASIRAEHARHFAALAARADPMLRTSEQLVWVAQLDAERDNIVAALRFLADDGQPSAALDVAVAMSWYWVLMGRHSEAATWTGFALAADGEVDPVRRLLGEALVSINAASSLWSGSADDVADRIRAMGEVNAKLDEYEGGELIHPLVRVLRPVIAMFTDDWPRADRLIEEGMTSDDPWTVASLLAFRAAMAENRGEAAQARDDIRTALAEFRRLGERWGMSNCLQLLAPLNQLAGDLDEAAANYHEALSLFAQLGASEDESVVRLRLADVLFRQGRLDEARHEVETALRHAETKQQSETLFGSATESIFAGLVLADIERQTGNMARARTLRDDALARLAGIPEPHPVQGHATTMTYALAAKIDMDDGDLASAALRLERAYGYGLRTRDMPVIATMGIAVAMYAERRGRPADAMTILGASARLGGGEDRTAPDVIRLRQAVLDQIGGPALEQAYELGFNLERDAATERLDPKLLND